MSNPCCFLPGCREVATKTIHGARCCERHAILRRARWRCEAIVPDSRPWVEGFVRCPIVGSEVDADGDEARCPRHRPAPVYNIPVYNMHLVCTCGHGKGWHIEDGGPCAWPTDRIEGRECECSGFASRRELPQVAR